MRARLARLQPKTETYRSYKNFTESLFLEDIQNTDCDCDSDDPNIFYESLVITNKGGLNNNNITLINNNSIITDEKELVSLFNDNYI